MRIESGSFTEDDFDDLIVRGDVSNFVIFGKASGFDATFPLSSLDGSNGFRLDLESSANTYAYSVSGAGDVNGDGFEDLIIGSTSVHFNPDFPGSNYVVFGKASGFDAQLDLSNLDGNNGFRVDGENSKHRHELSNHQNHRH